MSTGKKKKKQAIQQQQAVALPHDGPLLSLMTTKHTGTPDDGHAIVQKALYLLLSLRASSVTSNEEKFVEAVLSSSSSNNERNQQRLVVRRQVYLLLYKLQTCQQIQHQLAALQTCKTILLQQQQQGTDDNDDMIIIAALYRILLEWSASHETPLPLRKSIHGLLDALWKLSCCTITTTTTVDASNDEKTLSDSMTALVVDKSQTLTSTTTSTSSASLLRLTYISVLESITSLDHNPDNNNAPKEEEPSSSSSPPLLLLWKKPVHSLDVLLTLALQHHATTRQLFEKSQQQQQQAKDHDSDNDDHGKNEFVIVSSTDEESSLVSVFLGRIWPYLEWFASTQFIPQLILQQQRPHALAATTTTTTTTTNSLDQTGRNDDDDESSLDQALQASLLTLLEALNNFSLAEGSSFSSARMVPSSSCRQILSQLTWSLLVSPWTPTESLVVVAMAHGQLLASETTAATTTADNDNDSNNRNNDSHDHYLMWKTQLTRSNHDSNLPDLPRAVWLQGLLAAAAATDQDLFVISSTSNDAQSQQEQPLLWVFLQELTTLVSTATNPEVRLAAIKGLRTLTHRCTTWITNNNHNNNNNNNNNHNQKQKQPWQSRSIDCAVHSYTFRPWFELLLSRQ
jgi:hypothetical protein